MSNPFNIPDLEVVVEDGKTFLPLEYTGFKEKTWFLNPMQELLVPHIESPNNLIVCAPTSSGKSTATFTCGAPALREDRSVLYVAPYKALAEEKLEDFASGPWAHIPRVVISGDHPWTNKQAEAARKARLICVTPESLLAVLRKSAPEKTNWLNNVDVIVFDEVHLVTSKNRGVTIETMIMEVAERRRQARLVALSATIPNADEIQEWFSRLTERQTDLVVSDYRPVPITRHFYNYPGKCNTASEEARTQIIQNLVRSFSKRGEEFLLGVWKKAFGYKLQKHLKQFENLEVPFHNANLTKTQRSSIEQEFRMRQLPGIIATSTVFVGVNLPGRHVIISATEAGGDWIEVHELLQAEGRAGRPQYDTEAHAHYLVPEGNEEHLKDMLERGPIIRSNFFDPELVATHFLGAVYTERVQTFQDFLHWFKRTLYYGQTRSRLRHTRTPAEIDQIVGETSTSLLNNIILDMEEYGLLLPKEDLDDPDEPYTLTKAGVICAQTMANPYTLDELIRSFRRLGNLQHVNEMDLAKAIGNITEFENMWAPGRALERIPRTLFEYVPQHRHVAVATIWAMMAQDDLNEAFQGPAYQISEVVRRYGGVLARIKNETKQLNGLNLLDYIAMIRAVMKRTRIVEAKAQMPNAPANVFTKLFSVGLYTNWDIKNNQVLARETVGEQWVKMLLARAGLDD